MDECGDGRAKARRGLRIAVLPKDRLIAFTDGVHAIVITLLVLEFPVPEVTDGLLGALASEWSSFPAYIIIFVFIGGDWMTHASVSHLTTNDDRIIFRADAHGALFHFAPPVHDKPRCQP
jgi:uncharacterized membrane protein